MNGYKINTKKPILMAFMVSSGLISVYIVNLIKESVASEDQVAEVPTLGLVLLFAFNAIGLYLVIKSNLIKVSPDSPPPPPNHHTSSP